MAERTVEEKLRAVAEHETAQATVIKNWFIPDEPSETLASLCTRAADAIASLSRDLEESNGYVLDGKPMSPRDLFNMVSFLLAESRKDREALSSLKREALEAVEDLGDWLREKDHEHPEMSWRAWCDLCNPPQDSVRKLSALQQRLSSAVAEGKGDGEN